ncbi:aldolase [Roseospira marina]|uniref:Aldolase n=1 Tax=Roseospira marina TaxID=140057 RepID=A0A5M6I8D4_9PROT|nr:aldolase/citrate lyase family protein [Roseospira marina]KAA5604187.1 aldolase [Roseospira marina]MBB4315718.1 4-hydroxy-2-oxoheptanedioate aldolase [Roseospira marina]MBB5088830.1 4-hydroxy-2-oxoheptanedioate aldolase [Roseospira marina]
MSTTTSIPASGHPKPLSFAERLRARERMIGYWTQLPVPAVQERIARHGYDYVCFDAQHGFHDYHAVLNGMIGIEAGAALAGSACGGMVRVAENSIAVIGQALDAGARGVIVPLINTAEEAKAAVAACRYPSGGGMRSYGPMRAGLRSGPETAVMNVEVACIVMIETRQGLANVEEIVATPGIDGLYIGPMDLMLALGGSTINDPSKAEDFEGALARILAAAKNAGVAAGIHTMAGDIAAKRLNQGFTFASVSSDLNHLDKAAAEHLKTARLALVS